MSHTDDGIVHGGVAMGVILTNDITDYTRRLLVRLIIIIIQLAHGEQHPSMHRFQTIANVGQSPADNDTHGIVHIGLAHLVFYIDANLVLFRKHPNPPGVH